MLLFTGLFVAAGTPTPDAIAAETLPPASPIAIDPPAPPGSILPALAVEGATTFNREHDILMTWLEPGESGGRLKFARYSGGSWLPPVTVASGVSQLDPVDDASLTVIETQGPRRTLLARTGNVLFRSPDAGRAWTALTAPRLPFSSLAGGEQGAYAFWLEAAANGRARLLGTRVMAGGTVLDPETTPGVVTAAAMTWDGPMVVYRDGDRLAMVRRQEANWTPPSALAGSEGQPARNPESGPRIAVSRRQVAVAWVAESASGPRLRVAFSADAGRSFAAPVELETNPDAGTPSGPLAIAVDEDGGAFVLWRAHTRTEATLNLSRLTADGRQSDELVLARVPAIHLRGRPQLARAKDRLVASWTEGVLARVRAAIVPAAAVPPPRERKARTMAAAGSSRTYAARGREGDPAPELELATLAGEQTSLASLRGRAVLVNLWATWCVPCIGEMPELAALEERYGARGLTVVGVNVDSSSRLETVKRFVTERRLPFAVWLDPEMRIPHALRVPALPATVVLDREGTIVLRLERPITAADPPLVQALERVLGSR